MNNYNRTLTPEILTEMINHTKCMIGRCQQQIEEPDTYYDCECAKQEIHFFRQELADLLEIDIDKWNAEFLENERLSKQYEEEAKLHPYDPADSLF